jgi:Holliday junction resolvasome RuvABC endonuclease subunit
MKLAEAKRLTELRKKSVNKFLLDNVILAIDPAEKTGWALSNGEHGLWDFKLKRDETFGYKLINFERKMSYIVEKYGVKIISFERPSGHHANAVISHSKFVAIIETFCINKNIEHRGYSAKEIKKFATGNGNAGKPLMIKAAQDKFGYEGGDDNVADAICILNLTIKELK